MIFKDISSVSENIFETQISVFVSDNEMETWQSCSRHNLWVSSSGKIIVLKYVKYIIECYRQEINMAGVRPVECSPSKLFFTLFQVSFKFRIPGQWLSILLGWYLAFIPQT